jgi:hypothetical protein
MSETAENTEPTFDYISTKIVIHELDRRWDLVIPKDITTLEGACFTALMVEFANRFVGGTKWEIGERIGHFGLSRFLVEAKEEK